MAINRQEDLFLFKIVPVEIDGVLKPVYSEVASMDDVIN